MPALTTLLLAIGTMLALLGVFGFTLVWTQPDPDHHSLQLAAAVATIGRRAAATGLLLYLGHHGLGGAGSGALILTVGAAALATYITKTTNRITGPAGATP
jgi:hypothetical protein